MAIITPKKRVLKPLIRLSDVIPREMKWLWHPYIPVGAATMLFGPGGIGKSHIACAIASAVSNGEALPGQNVALPPGKVLMLSAEDDLEVVLAPRLAKMKANMKNILVSPNTFVLDKQGLRDVDTYIRESSAVIAFIDPIVAWMGGRIDMNRMNEVRELVGTLHTTAQQTECAIIIVHHARKAQEGDDYAKAAGSADFVNAVRSTLYVSRTNDGTRVMRHVKSNYAKEGDSLAYSFDEEGFHWGETFDDQGHINAPKSRPKDHAGKWLKEVLSNGPLPSKVIDNLASEAGIAPATLNRAKGGIAESFVRRSDGKMTWFWRLIGDNRKEQNNGNRAEIPSVESGGYTEVPDRRDSSQHAVDQRTGSGDSGPDGEVGEDRGAESETAGSDRGGTDERERSLGGQLHTRGRPEAGAEAEEETEEQAMIRRTQEARARARAFLEERGIG